jgi:AcrR family transcriptional regulator
MNEADPRVKRTRKLLQDAFMALLGEKSFHAISVQDIAERATLNRATFYAHFEDKYALMDYMVRDLFRGALGQRLPAGAPFTLANLHLLVVTACEFLGQFHGHCTPGDREVDPRLEEKVQQEVYTFLLSWPGQAQAGGASSGAQRETAAMVLSWAIFGAGIAWSRSERTLTADEWARQVVAVVVGGIAQDAGVSALTPQPEPSRNAMPARGHVTGRQR